MAKSRYKIPRTVICQIPACFPLHDCFLKQKDILSLIFPLFLWYPTYQAWPAVWFHSRRWAYSLRYSHSDFQSTKNTHKPTHPFQIWDQEIRPFPLWRGRTSDLSSSVYTTHRSLTQLLLFIVQHLKGSLFSHVWVCPIRLMIFNSIYLTDASGPSFVSIIVISF